MNIYEAKEAFIEQWDKMMERAESSNRLYETVDEQNTQLHIVTPGYDFLIYGGDSDEENLVYFLNLFCDYVHGETNINTINMIWFSVKTHIVLLWKTKED